MWRFVIAEIRVPTRREQRTDTSSSLSEGVKGGIMNYAKALAMCGATLIGAVGIGLTAAPARAASPAQATVIGYPHEIATRAVGYGDLNLATASGQHALNGRVTQAAYDVCDEIVGWRDDPGMTDCQTDARASARPQVARAVQTARDFAGSGKTSLAAAAITIDLGR